MMMTTDLLEYSKTTLSNKSQLSSRYNFRQILSPLVQETVSDIRDNKSLNTQNPLLTDKSCNEKAFILVTEETDAKELMQTCFSGSMIDSQYLRQNEAITTEECEQENDITEPSFMVDNFKKQNLQAEVLDYKQLTQNALRNIEMLQKQISLPLPQRQAESHLSLGLAQQNASTYESQRHDSQKSLISESNFEKTPKISMKLFQTNPMTFESKVQQPQMMTKSLIEQRSNENITPQYKTSPERFRHFSFSETKRRQSEEKSEQDYVNCMKIEQNSSIYQQMPEQVTISEIQQQQMNMTLVDHMTMQDYTDQPITHSHFGQQSSITDQPFQVKLRTRNNSTSGGTGSYFNGYVQPDSKLDHSSIQQFMTYDSSDNRLNSAQNDYSKILGGMKMGSIHNESITEKIRLLREDIHQLFPSGQRPQDIDSLLNGISYQPLAKSVDRSSTALPKQNKVNRLQVNFDNKSQTNRPSSIPPIRENCSTPEIQLLNVSYKSQINKEPQVLNTEKDLKQEVTELKEKLQKQKAKYKEHKERTNRRKENEAQKYQGEIQQLKVELKSIEEKYTEEVNRLENQYAKHRQAKHQKFNKIMKDLQNTYEQQIENERQLRRQIEMDLSEANLKIEMIHQQIRQKNKNDAIDPQYYAKITQKVEKQKDQEWKGNLDKMKREYENKINELKNRYELTIKDNQKENQEKFELELNLLREQKQKLFDENRKLNNQLSIIQFKSENASCMKCQSLLMTNSRLLVKLNKYTKGDDKVSQSRKSMNRENKQNFNLEFQEDNKSTRKSLEPCYPRQSKTGRMRDQQFRDKQNATTVDFKSALSDISKTSNHNKTRMNHTKRDSKQSQRSCERRRTYRDLPLQYATTNIYLSSDEDEDYHHN